MKTFGNITVLFVAGFGPIVRDAAASRKLYHQKLGISGRNHVHSLVEEKK